MKFSAPGHTGGPDTKPWPNIPDDMISFEVRISFPPSPTRLCYRPFPREGWGVRNLIFCSWSKY